MVRGSTRRSAFPPVQLIDDEGENHGDVPDPAGPGTGRRGRHGPRRDRPEFRSARSPRSSTTAGSSTRPRRKPPRRARSQKTIEIKEIKMRPNIDVHDYDVKMRAIKRFFEEGDKVKVTLRFRGREMAHHGARRRSSSNRVKEETATDRQGRGRAQARRPPDDDGPGAALRQRRSVSTSSGCRPSVSHASCRAPRCEALSGAPKSPERAHLCAVPHIAITPLLRAARPENGHAVATRMLLKSRTPTFEDAKCPS